MWLKKKKTKTTWWFKPQMFISYSLCMTIVLSEGSYPMLLSLCHLFLGSSLMEQPLSGSLLVPLTEGNESWRVFYQPLQRVTHITPTHNSLVILGHMAPVKVRKCNPTVCLEITPPPPQKNQSINKGHHTSLAYCVVDTRQYVGI